MEMLNGDYSGPSSYDDDITYEEAKVVYTEEQIKDAVAQKLHGFGDAVIGVLLLGVFFGSLYFSAYLFSTATLCVMGLYGLYILYKRLPSEEVIDMVNHNATKENLIYELKNTVQIMIDSTKDTHTKNLYLEYQKQDLPRLESFLDCDDEMTNRMFLDCYHSDIERLKGYSNVKISDR